jgi:hypothetical protein
MERDTALKTYHHFFEDIFRKQVHIRSEEVETLLGLLRDPFAGTSATARMLTNADIHFQPAITEEGEQVEITQGVHPRLMTDPDRNVRRTAWENYLDQYLAHQNTLATTLETSIKQNVLLSRVHGYESTLKAALFEYEIPPEIFHNLLGTFIDNWDLIHYKSTTPGHHSLAILPMFLINKRWSGFALVSNRWARIMLLQSSVAVIRNAGLTYIPIRENGVALSPQVCMGLIHSL